MDQTETYTKMCDHPAIQEHRPYRFQIGDFLYNPVSSAITVNAGCAPINGRVWLPRLDQWIGPGGLIGGIRSVIVYDEDQAEIILCDNNGDQTGSFEAPTPDQAACRAYMAQQGFKWTDSGWEVTE